MALKKEYPLQIESPSFDFITKFFQDRYQTISVDGAIEKVSGRTIYWDEILDLLEVARGETKGAPAEKAVQAALSHWRRLQGMEALARVANAQTYLGPSDDLQKFLLAMTGEVRHHDLLVMRHFMWQVKQKLFGRPVIHHMMPVFVGPSGSGKSIAINKLLAPLAHLVEHGLDFSVFAESKQWHIFGERYIILFDEMSKARKTDVESLKNTITADEKSYRKLHTNTTVKVPQRATFIGTSNEPVSNLIVDPTSARRFWEIQTLGKCDWDTINAINYVAMWRSVDEEEICPVLADLDGISAVQNKNVRAKSNPELWFEDRAVILSDIVTKAGDLYEDFRVWEDSNDPRSKTSSTLFGLRLSALENVHKLRKSDGVFYNVGLKRKHEIKDGATVHKFLKGQGK